MKRVTLPPGAGGLAALAVVLAALPFLLPSSYYLDIAVRMCIAAITVIGLNLLIGYTGQISLGHAGFFGIGAYASAILAGTASWPPLLAMAIGALLSAALAFLVARPILRLRGHYLAMATLGLGIIISIVLSNEIGWTGGPDGMPVGPLAVFGIEVAGERAWYAVCAVSLFAVTWLALNLVNSPAGRALRAIHGSEVAARVAGIDVASYKERVFVLSAAVASIAGSLFAHYSSLITPASAGVFHSVELVTMAVVGGMASIYGSIVGAVLLTLLPQALVQLEGWETIAFGLILIATMIFLPAGLVPTLSRQLRLRRRLQKNAVGPEPQ